MKDNRFITQSILSVLAKNWYYTLFLVISVLVSILLQLYPAFIMQRIIDVNFANGILEGVWRLALLYLLCSTGIHISSVLKVIITAVLGQKILNKIRMFMAKRLSELPMKYFTVTPVGEIMSRLTTDLFDVTEFAHHTPENIVIAAVKIAACLVKVFPVVQANLEKIMNALTTARRPWLVRSDSAPRSAAAFIFLGVRCS